MLVLFEHMLEYLLQYELPLEFPEELALIILPGVAHTIPEELALLLVQAHSLDLPDLECTLFGGHLPCPCSLVLYYHGCPTHSCENSVVVEIGSTLAVLSLLQLSSL